MSNTSNHFFSKIWRKLVLRGLHMLFLLQRPMTLGARAIIFHSDENAVMLVKHTYIKGWHLPGGGVDSGETIEGALRREISEECNILVTGKPQLLGLFHNSKTSKRDHVALYLVTEFKQMGKKDADREITDTRFFALDDLPQDVNLATKRRLDEIFGSDQASQIW